MEAGTRLEDEGEGKGVGCGARAAHCGEELDAGAGRAGGREAANEGVVEKGEVGGCSRDEREVEGQEHGGVAEIAGGGDRGEAEKLGEHRDGVGRREDVAATDKSGMEEPEVALRGALAGADK